VESSGVESSGVESSGRKKLRKKRKKNAKRRIVQFENGGDDTTISSKTNIKRTSSPPGLKGRHAQEEKNSTNNTSNTNGMNMNNTSGENNSNRNIDRDVERKEDDNTNTSSYNSDDGGREEETNDEWEKIRLYKERLVAKMAAYQQTLEKKRSQHGPNWLDGSPNVHHRKNRGQNRRTSLAVPRKINLHSSNDNKEKKEKEEKN